MTFQFREYRSHLLILKIDTICMLPVKVEHDNGTSFGRIIMI
jgi:hypothetical protein